MKEKQHEIGDIWVSMEGFELPENVSWDMIDMTPFPKWIYKEDGWEQVDKGDPEGIKAVQAHWDKFTVLHPNAFDGIKLVRKENYKKELDKKE